MGVGASKTANNNNNNNTTLVFERNEMDPSIPIHISPNLVRKLQGLQPEPRVSRSSTNRSKTSSLSKTISPKQPSDEEISNLVAARVQRELDLHTRRRLVFEARSAELVERDAEDLTRRLRLPPRGTVDPELVQKQQAVISCYKARPYKTLDCWKEVEELKTAVHNAEKSFVHAVTTQ